MILIVGSGPSSAMAAECLLNLGKKVIMIDSGIDQDLSTKTIIENLGNAQKGDWDQQTISDLRNNFVVGPSGSPRKLLFGSDHSYRQVGAKFSYENTGAIEPSYALGGYSNVWGSAAMAYAQKDIEDWPIRILDLQEYYREVAGLMPIAGGADALDNHFLGLSSGELVKSREIQALRSSLQRVSSKLDQSGVFFGDARLAVDVRNQVTHTRTCNTCGLCMFGCPYELIFNSRRLIERLKQHSNFQYYQGWTVSAIEENASGVRVSVEHAAAPTGTAMSLTGERVLVGAGVLNSTRLILKMLGLFDSEARILTSEYFLAPWLHFSRPDLSPLDDKMSLAELFLEVNNPAISDHWVHMQVYGYSNLYARAIQRSLPRLGFVSEEIAEFLAKRMFAIQGYLHSNESSTLNMTLAHNGSVQVRGVRNLRSPAVIRRSIRLLNGIAFATRAFIPWPLVKIGRPGEGRHIGGSLPMKKERSHPLHTDTLGRPMGLSRVHVIDASIFPSLPANTITLTVMANSRRIARRIALEF